MPRGFLNILAGDEKWNALRAAARAVAQDLLLTFGRKPLDPDELDRTAARLENIARGLRVRAAEERLPKPRWVVRGSAVVGA